jgi:hypothetical protein
VAAVDGLLDTHRYLKSIEPSKLEKLWGARRERQEPQSYSVKRVRTVLVDHAGGRYSRSELTSWGTDAVFEALTRRRRAPTTSRIFTRRPVGRWRVRLSSVEMVGTRSLND